MIRAAARWSAAAGAAAGAACGARAESFLDPAGPVAAAQAGHFGFVTLVMLAVIAPLFIVLPAVLWRYRRGGGRGRHRPDWDGDRRLEAVIWGVPAVALAVLGVQLWRQTMALDPAAPLGPDPLRVEVVALDWKFLFLYPDLGVAAVDLLALPQGRATRLTLTSASVMQSLQIPRLGGQIYAMGGMATELNLSADAVGSYEGRNTQFNGRGFDGQRFETRVMTPERFDAWLAETRAAPALSAEAYAALEQPSEPEAPQVFSTFPPHLFHDIMTRIAAGGEGG